MLITATLFFGTERGNQCHIKLTSLKLLAKISRFTGVKLAMSIFIKNIQVSIDLFQYLHLVHKTDD